MNFHPLRATLVFLFAASLAACSGGAGLTPSVPSTMNPVTAHIVAAGTCHQTKMTAGRTAMDINCTDCTTTNPCPSGCSPGDTVCAINPQPPTGCAGMGLPDGCMTPPGGGCLAGDPNCGGTPCHPISSCVALNASCPNALSINTTSDGTNVHNSQISEVLSLWENAPSGNFEFAYEYQTYGGSEYIQFNYNVSVAIGPIAIGNSVGPLYYMNGSWLTTLQKLLGTVHKTTNDLPAPFNQLGKFQVRQLPCVASNAG